VDASTLRRLSATLVVVIVALSACADKGSNVEPTTTSPSPTMVHTSPPMLPSSSVASANPSPSLEPR
jgi:hypothetical protein